MAPLAHVALLPLLLLAAPALVAAQFADTNFPVGPKGLVNETVNPIPPPADSTTFVWRGRTLTVPNQAPVANTSGACTASNVISGCADPSYVWNCDAKKTVGLVFDDGPNYWTTDILNALAAANNAKATFCMVGRMIMMHPAGVTLLKQVIDGGHDVCIHTLNHQHLSSLSNEEIAEEIMGDMQVFRDVLGPTFIPRFLRPPFGDLDSRVKAIAETLGLKVLLWNLDSKDFVLGTNASATEADYLAPYLRYLEPGNSLGYITLSHDIVNQTRLLMPTIMQIIKNASYEVVLPSQCTGMGRWLLPDDIAKWVDYGAPTRIPGGVISPTPFVYADPSFVGPVRTPAPVGGAAAPAATGGVAATGTATGGAQATATATAGATGSTAGKPGAAASGRVFVGVGTAVAVVAGLLSLVM
ncbi:carbohydrate esterase family 4 protein [Gonapodya prolifera JEL478]|uniref:Carbohydrate esterase family 4 protein n=1 Tax=Gonapodya prolifera (strain JEL478) TaxID=1344416 RepID=A0A139A2K8_GONPJ|nr:carbohydrate esterase family 4 protein [Gonapodya prolifera JEL478]|eukprot:KXS10974.1 carbohydrate esterase family 4 protein [Gonapodya prolifera JEL478]